MPLVEHASGQPAVELPVFWFFSNQRKAAANNRKLCVGGDWSQPSWSSRTHLPLAGALLGKPSRAIFQQQPSEEDGPGYLRDYRRPTARIRRNAAEEDHPSHGDEVERDSLYHGRRPLLLLSVQGGFEGEGGFTCTAARSCRRNLRWRTRRPKATTGPLPLPSEVAHAAADGGNEASFSSICGGARGSRRRQRASSSSAAAGTFTNPPPLLFGSRFTILHPAL
ncbi:hypothetical protein PR202_ga14125 [Eleusine coracana subsp. coracana]|uniref:Uncharacterized protein n=1 Tax=Eleusine coracana subsp. coracana TaxID=191504 RepID=A0AAV5CGQ5_ELECO|nr:hypothetical protein PR202_ga14125 [Eleusine coracana subsp. coracana]